MTLIIETRPAGSGAIGRAILATIPDWFGVPASNAEYAALAETGPAVLVLQDSRPVGLMLLKRHFMTALEVYFIAVIRERHRQGAGRALMAHTEAVARAEGRRFVQVKTQGPSAGHETYERTRRFYEAIGYAAIEELTGDASLWGARNPTLIMVKAVGR